MDWKIFVFCVLKPTSFISKQNMSTLKFFLFFISLSLVLAQVCEECTEPFGKSRYYSHFLFERHSWPECLHKDVEECKQIILKSFKRAEIQVIHDVYWNSQVAIQLRMNPLLWIIDTIEFESYWIMTIRSFTTFQELAKYNISKGIISFLIFSIPSIKWRLIVLIQQIIL